MSEFATFPSILKSKRDENDNTVETFVDSDSNKSLSKEKEIVPKPRTIESFVSEEDTKKIMSQVFIGVGLMIGAMFLAFLFTWAYDKEKTLFVAVYAAIMLLFGALVIGLVAVIRSQIQNEKIFYVLVGSSAFVGVLNIVFIIVFSVLASKRLRRGSYVPPAVSDYINAS